MCPSYPEGSPTAITSDVPDVPFSFPNRDLTGRTTALVLCAITAPAVFHNVPFSIPMLKSRLSTDELAVANILYMTRFFQATNSPWQTFCTGRAILEPRFRCGIHFVHDGRRSIVLHSFRTSSCKLALRIITNLGIARREGNTKGLCRRPHHPCRRNRTESASYGAVRIYRIYNRLRLSPSIREKPL